MEWSLFECMPLNCVYKTLRLSPSSAPSPTLYVSPRPLRAAAPLPSIDIIKSHPTFLGSHNYCSILTCPPSLVTMASQLTLQTKVKLPSGHQIPQLGYGVSAVLPGFVYHHPHLYCCCTPGRPADMKCPTCSSGRRENPPRLSPSCLGPGASPGLADTLLALKTLLRASA